jgi:hypothetical protein
MKRLYHGKWGNLVGAGQKPHPENRRDAAPKCVFRN